MSSIKACKPRMERLLRLLYLRFFNLRLLVYVLISRPTFELYGLAYLWTTGNMIRNSLLFCIHRTIRTVLMNLETVRFFLSSFFLSSIIQARFWDTVTRDNKDRFLRWALFLRRFTFVSLAFTSGYMMEETKRSA